jgi:hypothetical protein
MEVPPNQPEGNPPVGGNVPPEMSPSSSGQAGPGYANYPRYFEAGGAGPIPPGPPGIRFAVIGEAWEIIRKDWSPYILAMLLFAVVSYAASFIVQLPVQLLMMRPYQTQPTPGQMPTLDMLFPSSPIFWLGQFIIVVVPQAIQFTLGAGMFSLCLKRLRGQAINATNVFDGFKYFPSLAVAGMLSIILRLFAMAAFIIPAFFVCGGLAFVAMLILDQKMSPFEAISASFNVLKNELFMMGLLCFCAAFLAEIGGCACLVGALFTGPLYFMTLAMHYHAYFPPQRGPEYPNMAPMPQYSV